MTQSNEGIFVVLRSRRCGSILLQADKIVKVGPDISQFAYYAYSNLGDGDLTKTRILNYRDKELADNEIRRLGRFLNELFLNGVGPNDETPTFTFEYV